MADGLCPLHVSRGADFAFRDSAGGGAGEVGDGFPDVRWGVNQCARLRMFERVMSGLVPPHLVWSGLAWLFKRGEWIV
jgi:hypothetical protein